MADRICARCGDVLLYCDCEAEFQLAREELRSLGVDPTGLDPWEVHHPSQQNSVHGQADRDDARRGLLAARALLE